MSPSVNKVIYLFLFNIGALCCIVKLPDEVCVSHTKRVGEIKKLYNYRRSNFCRNHRDKIEVPDPLVVEDLTSDKLNNRRK